MSSRILYSSYVLNEDRAMLEDTIDRLPEGDLKEALDFMLTSLTNGEDILLCYPEEEDYVRL